MVSNLQDQCHGRHGKIFVQATQGVHVSAVLAGVTHYVGDEGAAGGFMLHPFGADWQQIGLGVATRTAAAVAMNRIRQVLRSFEH